MAKAKYIVEGPWVFMDKKTFKTGEEIELDEKQAKSLDGFIKPVDTKLDKPAGK